MWQTTIRENRWRITLLLFLVFLSYFGFKWQQKTGEFNYVVRSDGSGYYAYLPAFFIYDDPTFELTKQNEAVYHNGDISNYYVFKTAEGKHYNKYFPGLAVLQLPFFLLACLFAKLIGAPVDGYSTVFQVFFWIGSLVYAFAGLFLWLRFLRLFFKEKTEQVAPALLLFCVATPVVFYSFFTPSFTHVYSLFLFGALLNVVIKLRDGISSKGMILTGVLLGGIFLLRPTNLVILLAIPILWNEAGGFKDWLNRLFRQHLRKVFWLIISFLTIASILPLMWKWQTGNWVVWSYSGEGFDFLHPPLWSTLFSFRMGLFLHTPVLLLVGIGWWFWFREKRFQAIWWAVYAMVNCWVIFSWWCWDYESPFGNRPFTEHMILLILPLFFVLKKRRLLVLGGLVFFALVGVVRLCTQTTGWMSDQRFTKENYLSSLCFWDKANDGRWYFTQSCEPHGAVTFEQELLMKNEQLDVKPADEFVLTTTYTFPKNRNGARYYLRATLDKWVVGSKQFENVFLVVDASRDGLKHRFYKAIDLYNDKLEARNTWKSLVFETQVYDFLEEYDHVTVYIWNPGKQHFQLRNIRFLLQCYR